MSSGREATKALRCSPRITLSTCAQPRFEWYTKSMSLEYEPASEPLHRGNNFQGFKDFNLRDPAEI